jgi:hypothetical protein
VPLLNSTGVRPIARKDVQLDEVAARGCFRGHTDVVAPGCQAEVCFLSFSGFRRMSKRVWMQAWRSRGSPVQRGRRVWAVGWFRLVMVLRVVVVVGVGTGGGGPLVARRVWRSALRRSSVV